MMHFAEFRRWAGLVLAAGTVLWGQTVAGACPACSESLFNPSQLHQKLMAARGYALSIALLLAVPCGIVGTVTTLVIRAHRRKAHRID